MTRLGGAGQALLGCDTPLNPVTAGRGTQGLPVSQQACWIVGSRDAPQPSLPEHISQDALRELGR